MDVVESRFYTLVDISRQRDLSNQEQVEFEESIQYLLNRAWKKALLENYSLMASMTNDTEWQHEICADIERLN